jgi:hypothetical protein
MKAILKTIDKDKDLDYEQPFNSFLNNEIRRKLIPELKASLTPNFHPTVTQLTKWLNSLHKSRRSQLKLKKNGKFGEDQRRVHNNNRVQEVIRIQILMIFLITLYVLIQYIQIEKITSIESRESSLCK